jgi:hypothetical protein
MQFLKELIIFPFFANDETAIAKFWENRTSLLIGPFACVGFLEDRVKNTRGKRPWEPSLLSPQSLVRYYTLLLFVITVQSFSRFVFFCRLAGSGP